MPIQIKFGSLRNPSFIKKKKSLFTPHAITSIHFSVLAEKICGSATRREHGSSSSWEQRRYGHKALARPLATGFLHTTYVDACMVDTPAHTPLNGISSSSPLWLSITQQTWDVYKNNKEYFSEKSSLSTSHS